MFLREDREGYESQHLVRATVNFDGKSIVLHLRSWRGLGYADHYWEDGPEQMYVDYLP